MFKMGSHIIDNTFQIISRKTKIEPPLLEQKAAFGWVMDVISGPIDYRPYIEFNKSQSQKMYSMRREGTIKVQ
jgi:hypothetical protein